MRPAGSMRRLESSGAQALAPFLLRGLLCAALVFGGLVSRAKAADEASEDARIRHLLSRAAFGPTPALMAEVRAKGRLGWIAEQLAPAALEDPALAERLAIYPALEMSPAELRASYPRQDGEAPAIGRPLRIVGEMQASLVTRAVHARAQLREVLTDFWFNHFNVFAPEGPMPYLTLPHLRDAIRPHVLGRFEELLRATAESPAMLYYLDNYLSSARRGRRDAQGGINENYARELLELHTLGADGPYTQADVIEVARAFTGWTIAPPESPLALGFVFHPPWHESGDKLVLGTPIPAGGKDEGDRILAMLARHPSTAAHVATKLAARLVSDEPPAELVARARDTYLATDGDLAWVVLSILTSEEFDDLRYRHAKIKTPLGLTASALRAVGARIDLGVEAARLVADLGQGLALCQPPDGWPEVASEIVSAGAMVTRFELAHRVASDAIPGVQIDAMLWDRIVSLWGVQGLARYLLQSVPGNGTLAALEQARAEGASGALLATLVLSSPEFQRQ